MFKLIKIVLEAASRAIEFWAFQHDLSKQGDGEAEKLRQRINEMEKSHQQSILLLQNNMKSLSSQLDSVKMERDIQKRELIELHEQYSERTRQKKQLEELYNKLKNKSDDSLTASPRTSPFPMSSSSPFKPKTFIQPSSKVVNKESKSDIFKTGSPLSKHKPSPVKYNMKNLFNSQNSRSTMRKFSYVVSHRILTMNRSATFKSINSKIVESHSPKCSTFKTPFYISLLQTSIAGTTGKTIDSTVKSIVL